MLVYYNKINKMSGLEAASEAAFSKVNYVRREKNLQIS